MQAMHVRATNALSVEGVKFCWSISNQEVLKFCLFKATLSISKLL